MADLNFGLLNTQIPAQAANGLMQGFQQGQQNNLLQSQLRSADNTNALSQYQLASAKRADSDELATRNAFVSNAGDLSKTADALEGQGLYKQSFDLRAKMADQQKAKVAQSIEHAKLFGELSKSVLANPTQEAATAAVAKFSQVTGIDPAPSLAEVQALGDNPDTIRQWAAGHTLSADKLIPKLTNLSLGGTERMLTQDPITGKVINQQDYAKTASPEAVMADARIRAEGAANRANTSSIAAASRTQADRHFNDTQNQSHYDPNIGWVGKDGVVKPITVNGMPVASGKALTENQGKATALGMRAIQAEETIKGLDAEGFDSLNIKDRMSASVPFDLARGAMSGSAQQYENAQRNFISAVLRKESGAAISASEFENERKKYFPQVGDDPSVIAQKGQQRKLAIEGLKAEAGQQGTKDMLNAPIQRAGKTTAPSTTPNTPASGAKFLGFE